VRVNRVPFVVAPSRAPLRPLALLAAKFLRPGHLRLRLVRFAHHLERDEPPQPTYGKAA
jgi:hypothetical protein